MPSQSAQGKMPKYLPGQSSEFSAVCAVSGVLMVIGGCKVMVVPFWQAAKTKGKVSNNRYFFMVSFLNWLKIHAERVM